MCDRIQASRFQRRVNKPVPAAMVAPKKAFKIDDLVFAKVKGYPPWPAKITRIEKRKYHVYFYGTGETAIIKREDLFLYETSKEKLATERMMKRMKFKAAIEQIESAMNGDDPSLIKEESIAKDVDAVKSGMDDIEEQKLSISAEEATFDESLVSANSTVVDTSTVQLDPAERHSGDENNSTSTPVVSQIKKETKSTPTSPKSTVAAVTAAKKSASTAAAAAGAATAVTPLTNNGAQKKEANNHGTPQHDGGSGGENQPDAVEPKEVVSRSGRKIKMKRFMDGDEEDPVGPPAKKRAPTSPAKEKTLPTPPTATKKPSAFDKIENERLYVLKLERELVELNLDIKSSVKLNSADPERCVKLMEQYEKLAVTPTILKKNPNCVETMKRLRKYVGNAKAWNMEEHEQVRFAFQAQQIRQKAEHIYNQFKKILGISDTGVPFWEAFRVEVTKFEEATKHLSPEELYLLIDETDVNKGVNDSSTGGAAAVESNEPAENDTLPPQPTEGTDEPVVPEATAPEETNAGD